MQEEPHSILRIGKRVNAVRQGPDGLRYGFTDESNGRLMRSLPDGNAASPRAHECERGFGSRCEMVLTMERQS